MRQTPSKHQQTPRRAPGGASVGTSGSPRSFLSSVLIISPFIVLFFLGGLFVGQSLIDSTGPAKVPATDANPAAVRVLDTHFVRSENSATARTIIDLSPAGGDKVGDSVPNQSKPNLRGVGQPQQQQQQQQQPPPPAPRKVEHIASPGVPEAPNRHSGEGLAGAKVKEIDNAIARIETAPEKDIDTIDPANMGAKLKGSLHARFGSGMTTAESLDSASIVVGAWILFDPGSSMTKTCAQ
jgi:hypothetical protein